MSQSNGKSPNGQTVQRQQKRGSSSRDKQQFLESIVEAGIDEELPTPVKNLLSKDFPLANIRRSDREYLRLLSENISLYVQEQFPPEESLIQGDVGACLLDDPGYKTQALSQAQKNEIESLLLTTFARSSRGVDGWQQDKLNESVSTKRVEDAREPEQSDGLLEGIFQ